MAVCVSVAEKQCCLGSLKENLCEAGMTSARGGDTCEVDEEKQCADDSYQVRHCLNPMRPAELFSIQHSVDGLH